MTEPPRITTDELEQSPAFKPFLDNFARHCGTSKAVFIGQLTKAVNIYCGDLKASAETAEKKLNDFSGFTIDNDPAS